VQSFHNNWGPRVNIIEVLLQTEILKIKQRFCFNCSILETILRKDTVEHIWDSMKKKYQGTIRAKRQQFQTLRSEFEMLRMKSGELIIDYFSRTMKIVNKM
jgi:hypothetical protein